jgi:preprotein translocase subunit SecE
MNAFISYVKESYIELIQKVSWPTLKELQGSSILVLIATFIISILMYLMDAAFGQILEFIYKAIY